LPTKNLQQDTTVKLCVRCLCSWSHCIGSEKKKQEKKKGCSSALSDRIPLARVGKVTLCFASGENTSQILSSYLRERASNFFYRWGDCAIIRGDVR